MLRVAPVSKVILQVPRQAGSPLPARIGDTRARRHTEAKVKGTWLSLPDAVEEEQMLNLENATHIIER